MIWIRAFLLILFQYVVYEAASLQLELGYGELKCISETIPSNTPVRGHFEVAAGEADMPVSLTVHDDIGATYYRNPSLTVHKFDFRTPHAPSDRERTFSFCLAHQTAGRRGKPYRVKRKIFFSIDSGLAAEQAQSLAKTKHIDKAHRRIDKLDRKISAMLEDMDRLRANEEAISRSNDDTNKRVIWYSLFACVLMVAVGFYQVRVVKSFFRRRKMV